MKVDMMVPSGPLRQIQDQVRDAARAGFSGIVITEAGRTAYLSCAAAALAADIDILTGIAVAFPRSPMVTAQAAWELADTTSGRFRLGIGTQVRAHIERRYAAAFDPPGPRLREYVEALRAIFRAFRGEERLAFEGRFWSRAITRRMQTVSSSHAGSHLPWGVGSTCSASRRPWTGRSSGTSAKSSSGTS